MGFEVNKEILKDDEYSPELKYPRTQPVSRDVFEWIDTFVVALVTVVIIFTFFFRIATIVGDSMQNTLYQGERIVVSNLFYTPKNGDIVVISRNTNNEVYNHEHDSEPIIKRVIATGGQFVDIDFVSGKVYVGPDLSNMQELDEPYTKTLTTRKFEVEFPLYVDEGYIFVLGDNRGDSLDSRSDRIGENGLIDERYVLGKAIFRIWPFDRIGGLSADGQ